MIDIFRPGILLRGLDRVLEDPALDGLIKDLARRAYKRTVAPQATNLYISRGIGRTRDYHVDGWTFKLKTFHYVTDVSEPGDGPYCYGRGSHRSLRLKALNRLYNAIDRAGSRNQGPRRFEHFNPARRAVLTGQPGDLIVSTQNGAHRGFPQAPDRTRYMLVKVYE